MSLEAEREYLSSYFRENVAERISGSRVFGCNLAVCGGFEVQFVLGKAKSCCPDVVCYAIY